MRDNKWALVVSAACVRVCVCAAHTPVQAHFEGGALYLNENFLSFITVTNSSFSSNLAGIYGGAFSVYDSDLLITDSDFSNNTVRSNAVLTAFVPMFRLCRLCSMCLARPPLHYRMAGSHMPAQAITAASCLTAHAGIV